MKTTTVLRWIGAAALLVVAAAPAAAQAGGANHSPPGGALVGPGPAPDVTLLYTGDVIGYLDPCG